MSARKNTSVLWHHFEKDPKSLKAICNECRDVLSYRSSTANLKSHLKRRHPTVFISLFGADEDHLSPPSRIQETVQVTEPIPNTSTNCSVEASAPRLPLPPPPAAKRQKIIDSFITKKISVTQKKQIDHDLLDLCIDSFHPFSIVEERAFKKFCRWIPGYKLPTRKTLSGSLLPECYNKLQTEIKTQVSQEVQTICITTDLWTSRATESYIAVTGHYISEQLEPRTVLLGCCHFSGHHTALNIASELEDILKKWNVRDKVNFAVTDNASNMVKGIKEFMGIKHFGCFAHTLNLLVDDALKSHQELIEKIKKIVSHYKRSTLSSERLAKYQTQQNLPPKRLIQQVETRWNSTYYMIERIVELQEAVRSTLALVNNVPTLTSEDWTNSAQLCQALRPFEEMTRALSGEQYLTGSSVIVMVRCLKESCKKVIENIQFTDQVREVALLLKSGLDDRFHAVEQSGTLALNTFLDPRFKMQAFSDSNEAVKTKEKVRRLVAASISENEKLTSCLPETVQTANKDEFSPWNIFDNLIKQTTSSGTPLSKAIKEVDMYLADDILPRKNEKGEWNSPFLWWKNHRHVYPNLLKLFIKNCNIVATSVPCERMFSKSGLILNQRRTRLTTSKVEQLMFLNVNMDQERFNL